MKYIIVDLEATCWAQKDHNHKNEIIEIGAVCINEERQTESRFSEFVRPILNPRLSEFCTGLTTITQKDIDAADTFGQVVARFKSWIDLEEDYVLCSWGFYDRSQFASDCQLHHLDTKWLEHHISLKHQYAGIRKLGRPVGMGQALRLENLKLTGTHHRGIDDAVNIAKIFVKHFDHWDFG